MIRGERFEVDLGSDDESDQAQHAAPLPAVFVKDVLERGASAPKVPTAPTLKHSTGFPAHQKHKVGSRFAQRQQQRRQGDLPAPTPAAVSVESRNFIPESSTESHTVGSGNSKTWEQEEKERIDQENRQKLAQMSSDQIEEERRELMNTFSPGLLQRLLQRSNIENGSAETDLDSSFQDAPPEQDIAQPKSIKKVTFDEPEITTSHDFSPPHIDHHTHVAADALPHDSIHFPRPPQPPDLDPASDTFLSDLHQKYFPSLPSEPDKLEWMQSSRPSKVTYDSSATAFNANEIRFSFKGELLPPKTAAEIPVTAGLHHHGDAPDAAGYTIAELAHLARSSYPAQRCIAFQTLGRILFRLSKGEFGDPGEPGQDLPGAEDTFGELARGLWREVERTHVVQTLLVESEGNGVDGGRHISAKAYATEAVWLWQRGGGRRWKAG